MPVPHIVSSTIALPLPADFVKAATRNLASALPDRLVQRIAKTGAKSVVVVSDDVGVWWLRFTVEGIDPLANPSTAAAYLKGSLEALGFTGPLASQPAPMLRNPGEDAADRWSESHR